MSEQTHNKSLKPTETALTRRFRGLAHSLESMRFYRSERELVLLGGFLMFLAIAFELITLAGRDYGTVLIIALLLTIAADTVLGFAFYRGSFSIRFWSVIVMLPTLFILVDFIRRAPYAFGR